MKIPLISAVLAAGILFAACGGQREEKMQEQPPSNDPYTQEQLRAQDSLWSVVMAVHDSIMPKTSDINRMSQRFKKELKENTRLDIAKKSQLITVLEFLEQSDASMFDWMNNLRQPAKLREANTPHNDIISYLLLEQTAILKVRDAMITSLEAGNQLMKEHKIDF